MKPFDYVVMLVSLILAVAATELISGIGLMFIAATTFDDCWVTALWMLNTFLLLLIYWWAIYNDRPAKWYPGSFFFYFVQPTILSLMCILLKPEKDGAKAIEWSAVFSERRAAFLWLAAAVPIVTVLMPLVVRKHVAKGMEWAGALFGTVFLGIVAVFPQFTKVGTVVATGSLVIYCLLYLRIGLPESEDPPTAVGSSHDVTEESRD